jgi:hypothetical protein
MDLILKNGARYTDVQVSPEGFPELKVPVEDWFKDLSYQEAALTEEWLAGWIEIRGKKMDQEKHRYGPKKIIKCPGEPLKLSGKFMRINVLDINGVLYADVEVSTTDTYPPSKKFP